MAIALAGIALISSALVLKGGAPTPLKTPPVAPPANDIARAQNFSGETAGTPADISTMPPAGLSGTTPVAPEVDAQAVEGLASQPSAQTTDPEFARRVSVRPEGTLIASQVSSAAERMSAADTPKPPAKPASERMNGAVGTTQPSIGLPAQSRGKVTARVVVGKTEAAIPGATVDTPSPPLPIGTPVKPEREASGAKALQPITASVAAPATPAERRPLIPCCAPWAIYLARWPYLPGSPSISPPSGRLAGPFNWEPQDRRPKRRGISSDSTPNMGPRSGDRRSAFARSSLMARPSTDCRSSAYREMKLRRFAHE